jgi:hypothetical protein
MQVVEGVKNLSLFDRSSSKTTGLRGGPVKENMGIAAWIHVGLRALEVRPPKVADPCCNIG